MYGVAMCPQQIYFGIYYGILAAEMLICIVDEQDFH